MSEYQSEIKCNTKCKSTVAIFLIFFEKGGNSILKIGCYMFISHCTPQEKKDCVYYTAYTSVLTPTCHGLVSGLQTCWHSNPLGFMMG